MQHLDCGSDSLPIYFSLQISLVVLVAAVDKNNSDNNLDMVVDYEDAESADAVDNASRLY